MTRGFKKVLLRLVILAMFTGVMGGVFGVLVGLLCLVIAAVFGTSAYFCGWNDCNNLHSKLFDERQFEKQFERK